ncbi:MAG: hypothetical protein ABI667_09455 [Sphingomicrobium sp.]
MIFKRAVAKLRAQDWAAIAIELAIVVVGVFLGIWVANWNLDRAERRDIDNLLNQMRPELARSAQNSDAQRAYFAVTRKYAEVALGGWAGDPHVSDRDFIVSAYQASQIIGSTRDGQSYSMMLGGDQVRKIEDPFLRTSLMRLMSFNYEPVSLTSLQTRYRDHVREMIPDPIQEIIRARCGDNRTPQGIISLPAKCDADLPPSEVAKGAALLRAHPELAEELQLHLSRVATFLFNLSNMDGWVRDSAKGIDRRKR